MTERHEEAKGGKATLSSAGAEGRRALRLAILISGSGTTMQNIIDRIAAGELEAEIGVVIASRDGIGGIKRAEKAGLISYVVERSSGDLDTFSKRVFTLCEDAGVDLICLGGWLSLLKIPEKWAGRVMNIHPSLLPSFGGKGMFGQKVHQAALEAGVKISGCTVHFLDEGYDSGPIILQRACPVLEDDTAQTLAARVFEEERIIYPQAIQLFQQHRLKIENRRVRVLKEGEQAASAPLQPPTAAEETVKLAKALLGKKDKPEK
jgi:formyltetrahydrofolate-dependent phosphoribosylglycinamide formyltransferase